MELSGFRVEKIIIILKLALARPPDCESTPQIGTLNEFSTFLRQPVDTEMILFRNSRSCWYGLRVAFSQGSRTH